MKYYTFNKINTEHRALLSHELFGSFIYPSTKGPMNNFLTENSCQFIQKKLKNAAPKVIQKKLTDADITALRKRLHFSIHSFLNDPVPPNVLEEIYLILKSRPQIKLEYAGRNINQPETRYSPDMPTGTTFCLDILGGRRRYYWTIFPLKQRFQTANPDKVFEGLKKWFQDPDARIVLSLGSGGMRMFAMPTVLKILDMIGVRKNIDEIWGCSGGAIVGSFYSYGWAPHWIEQFGYDVYNEKFPEFALKKSFLETAKAVGKNIRNRLFSLTHATSGLVEVQSALQSMLQKVEREQKKHAEKIPFFAVATNTNEKILHALCEEEYLTEACKEILLPCSRIEAICASSAIPFIFQPLQLSASLQKDDVWTDGMVSEEVPIGFPYLKASLDNTYARRHKQPHKKKLKVFYVNLSVRSNEVGIFRYLKKYENVFGKIVMAGKILDKILDANLQKMIHGINLMENNEVIGVNLQLGKLAVLDITSIPYIITEGRKHFLNEMIHLSSQLAKSSDG